MKNIRIFICKLSVFRCEVLNIFEKACFRNVMSCHCLLPISRLFFDVSERLCFVFMAFSSVPYFIFLHCS